MADELYNLLTAEEARAVLGRFAGEASYSTCEQVALSVAAGRLLAEDFIVPFDVPLGQRSTMDGYAVCAAEISGASAGNPIYAQIDGEVRMGDGVGAPLPAGGCRRIWTGGFLPCGTDAVVMREYTEEITPALVEISQAVAAGENTLLPGEDFRQGELILQRGHQLRPQDIGVLAVFGVAEVAVKPRLKVGIIATGDEIVAPHEPCPPGKVRDVNSYTIASLMFRHGFAAKLYGIVPDREEELTAAVEKASCECDVVLLSGGSSIGARDLTTKVLSDLSPAGILFHGISVRPGKPTLFARVKGKPTFGLPGPPVSSYVIVNFFVVPFLFNYAGCADAAMGLTTSAIAGENIPSATGREDYLRVRVRRQQGDLVFYPCNQKSGLLSSLVLSDGYACVPAGCEGIRQGDRWEIILHE